MFRQLACLLALLAIVLTVPGSATLATTAAAAAPATKAVKPCARFNGTVRLTYHNPDTIVLHVIRGKVNAATTFTMTPTTTYTRNGLVVGFDAIQLGDVGTIRATEQLPSGVLLACGVDVTGP